MFAVATGIMLCAWFLGLIYGRLDRIADALEKMNARAEREEENQKGG